MIRPLRRLHPWVIATVAITSLFLAVLALSSRPGSVKVESLPMQLRNERPFEPERSEPSGEFTVGEGLLAWVDTGASLLFSTDQTLGPDLQVYLSEVAPEDQLPANARWLGALATPGTSRLPKHRLGESSRSFVVIYSGAHEAVVGYSVLDGSEP